MSSPASGHPSPSRRGARFAAIGATVALFVGMIGIATSTQASAAPGCKVDYSASNWGGGGFGGSVKITNVGDAVSNWTLKFAFPGNQKVTQGWNANWTQSGSAVTATSMSWNGGIGTGATV